MSTITDALRGQISPEQLDVLTRETDQPDQDQTTRVVYRPGVTPPTGSPVYATWQEAYDAAVAAKAFGLVAIEFDASYSTHLNGYGIAACPIPAGAYPHEGIEWYGRPQLVAQFGLPGRADAWIDILEGASVTGISAISGEGPVNVTYDGVTPNALDSVYLECKTVVAFTNTDAGAAPMMANPGGFKILTFTKAQSFGGVGELTGQPSAAAPVVDVGPGGSAFICLLQNGDFNEEMATGQGGNLILNQSGDSGQQNKSTVGTYTQSGVTAAGGLVISVNRYSTQRSSFGDLIGLPFGQPSPYVMTIWANLWVVDSTAGPIDITLPKTGFPQLIFDEIITIMDSAGQAHVNPITVNAAAGETFEDGSTSQVIATAFGVLQLGANQGRWNRYLKPLVPAVAPQTGAAATNALVAGGGEDGPTVAAASGWAQINVGGALRWVQTWT